MTDKMELSNSTGSLTRMDKENTMNPRWDSTNFRDKFEGHIDAEKDVSWVEKVNSPTKAMQRDESWGQFVKFEESENKQERVI